MKSQKVFIGSVSILIMLIASMLFNMNSQAIQVYEANTPTATSTENMNVIPPHLAFTPTLICPYFEEILTGYTWNGITIGESTQADLEAVLSGFDTYRIIYPSENSISTAIRYEVEKDYGFQITNIPFSVDICLQDGVITILYLEHVTKNNIITIEDLIKSFGKPNTVTWSRTYLERMVFWFEAGVGAEIAVYRGHELQSATDLFYFIPQNADGYEDRWPFAFTLAEDNSERDFRGSPFDENVYLEQNPFDFDSMIATMTAMPTFTPTPSP